MALDQFKGLDEKEIRRAIGIFWGSDPIIMEAVNRDLNDEMVLALFAAIETATSASDDIREVINAARVPLLDPQKKAKSILKLTKYFKRLGEDSHKLMPHMVLFAAGLHQQKMYDAIGMT